MPYVVKLAGEYVPEVIDATLTELATPGSPQHTAYGRFAAQNPEFTELTQARATSYWNEYHRHQYRSIASYPAHRFLIALKRARRDHTGYAAGAAS